MPAEGELDLTGLDFAKPNIDAFIRGQMVAYKQRIGGRPDCTIRD